MAAKYIGEFVYTMELMYFVRKMRRIGQCEFGMHYKGEKPIQGGVEVKLTKDTNVASWGEEITVTLTEVPNGTKVQIKSECTVPTQLIDWGENEKNVEKLFKYFEDQNEASIDYNLFRSKYGNNITFSSDFTYGTKYPVTPDLLQLYDVVETFKKEMVQWYDNGRADQDNPLSYASQELWYGMYLEKKRLEKRGIRMHHKALKTGGKDGCNNLLEFYNDGKYRVNSLGQLTIYQVNYIRNGICIGDVNSAAGFDHMFYYVLRAKNKNGLYICPNCGAEQPLEKLLDGCDYCNAKFDISAFNDKVICVNRVQLTGDSRSEDDEIRIAVRVTLAAVIMSICFIITIILIIPILIAGLCYIIHLKNKKASSERIFTEMYKRNPGTSKEELIASLDNKIKAIYFADRYEEVSAFVKCDITSFMRANQNVIRCQIGRFNITGYSVDANYQYMTVERIVRLLIDTGNSVKKRKDIVRMRLAKKTLHRMKSEISMYTCCNCGATVSLTEGGVCKYCGTEMEYDAYDWVIIDYKVMKS